MENKMKTFQILFLAVFSIFLIGNVSAVVVYGDWNDQSQTMTITDGAIAQFRADFGSMNPPMTMTVRLYDSQWNLMQSYPVSGYNGGNTYFTLYTITQTDYIGPGNYKVVLQGSDKIGSDSHTLNLIVNPVGGVGNTAPTITPIPDQNINEGQLFTYNVIANDVDGNTLTYSLINSPPAWLSINSATGVITGTTPLVSSNATYTINVQVDDGNLGIATSVFSLTVVDVTVPDTNAPIVTITFPVNRDYDSEITILQYLVSDVEGNLVDCWYSTNLGLTNSTPVSCSEGANSFALTSVEGTNRWTVYARDTAGNIGMDQVTFIVDTDTSGSSSSTSPRTVTYNFQDSSEDEYKAQLNPTPGTIIDLTPSDKETRKEFWLVNFFNWIANFFKRLFGF